ncbi:MAG: hypothetical protein IID05_12155, partial [Gemmatimonadetes bacterium]|nr:hypothetical protein [Gemmatimonadota bacterium]
MEDFRERTDLRYLMARTSQRWDALLVERCRVHGFPEVRPAFGSILLPLFQEDGLPHQVRFRRTRAEAVDDPPVNDNMVLGSFNEVTKDTVQTYDDIAIVALRIEANENLSGGIPVVTNLVQGIPVPTWDGVAGGAATPEIIYKFDNNTAWVALNILLDKQFGLGNWVELADIDIQSFYDWAIWNDEQLEYAEAFDEPIAQTDHTEAVGPGSQFIIIDSAAAAGFFGIGNVVRVELERLNQVLLKTDLGGDRFQIDLVYPVAGNYPARFTLSRFLLGDVVTDTRNTYDGVFDGELSVWEALLHVCRAGRAVPVKEGRKWR